jgi:1-phosphofructokinase family hexose kinase
MLILNPNPCFSRTLHMSHFERGAIMRTESAQVRAGGKGIDAARVAKSLDRKAPLYILLGNRDLVEYSRLLHNEEIAFHSVPFPGSVRVATMYVEPATLTTTIVNEEGPIISREDWNLYLAEIAGELHKGEMVACMGSFPMGTDQEFISDLVNLVHSKGAMLFMDTAPHSLKMAINAGVDIVSPNLDEAEAVINSGDEDFFVGNNDDGQVRAIRAAHALCNMGVKVAIVHAGELGTALAHGNEVTFIKSPYVKVKSAVGAGDSLAAGFILKSEEQNSRQDFSTIDWVVSAQFGVATAAAACEMGRSGDVDAQRVAELFLEVVNDLGAGGG